jgi:hypothetical protein
VGYNEDLNQFFSQNPEDSYVPNTGVGQPKQQGDPLVQGGADPGVKAPAPAYAGLTGDPFHTALIADAQITALRPRSRTRPQPPPQPFAGLSSYLGA